MNPADSLPPATIHCFDDGRLERLDVERLLGDDLFPSAVLVLDLLQPLLTETVIRSWQTVAIASKLFPMPPLGLRCKIGPFS